MSLPSVVEQGVVGKCPRHIRGLGRREEEVWWAQVTEEQRRQHVEGAGQLSDEYLFHDTSSSLWSRLAVVAYGLVAYAVGVTALIAVILQTLGVCTFTGGPLGALPWPAALVINVGLVIAFALQHSIMARAWFKKRWTRLIPAAAERSTYVLVTGLFLLPMLWLWQPIESVAWTVSSPALAAVIRVVAIAGWTYLFVASYAIDHFELFGLRQVVRHFRGRPAPAIPFRERWMYRIDRHPIMTGLLIGLWATPVMRLDHLVFAASLSLYLVVGVMFEERALRRELGGVYDDYARRVGTVVPFAGRLAAATR